MNNIITSCFFTSKNDPQRFSRLPNTFDPIKAWYDSIMEVGLNGILFYDDFDDEIISKYSNDNIKFIKDTTYKDQPFSAIEHRWILYKEYFKNNPYDNIFATDCTDVVVKNNPFNDIKFIINQDSFFIGKENEPKTNRTNGWMMNQFNYCYENNKEVEGMVLDQPVLNCGIVGGNYENFIRIATLMSDEILRINPKEEECKARKMSFTVDMCILNYICYTKLNNSNIVSDEPVHSLYKSYEETRDDVWFIHK